MIAWELALEATARWRLVFLALLTMTTSLPVGATAAALPARDMLAWQELAPLPQPISQHCVGLHNDVLIVAGGVLGLRDDFTVESDQTFFLVNGQPRWHSGPALDTPLLWGASVSTPGGVLGIGGVGMTKVLRLRYDDGRVVRDYLPDLPRPCFGGASALVGAVVYLAGGRESPGTTEVMHNFWALDLGVPTPTWEELQPWPGPARSRAMAAAQDGAFYVFGGVEMVRNPRDGTLVERCLSDAYRYCPGKGWEKLADLPWPVAGAAAVPYGQAHILIFGSSPGGLSERSHGEANLCADSSRAVLAYHTITDTWVRAGALPTDFVATQGALWQGRIVLPGGEDRANHPTASVLSAELVPAPGGFTFFDYCVLGTYLAVMATIGLYLARREKSPEDFFLAGRRIPWWAAGLSIFGTQLSAITFISIPAKAYASDWVNFLVNMTIILVTPFVVFFYLPLFRRLNITTTYEYWERRINLAVRVFGSMAFVLFQLGRMGIVLFLPALTLSTATGMSVYVSILLMGGLCTFYTVLGGIEAVIWTDVCQSIVLMGGAFIALVLMVTGAGHGLTGAFAIAQDAHKFHMFNWSWSPFIPAVWVILLGTFFANALPYTTDQSVVQRYLTTPTEKQAARAIWANAFLTLPASVLFFGLGTALFVFFKTRPELLDPTLKTDAVFPLFIVHRLPPGISGLVIAAIFAAAMSTLDSSLNSLATVMVTDYYRRFLPVVSDRACLVLAQVLTVVFGVFATATAALLAAFNVASLWETYLELMGLVGGTLVGVFALGIFTRRTTGPGALAGAVASSVVVYLVREYTAINMLLYAAIGFAACFATGYIASCILPHAGLSRGGLTWTGPSEYPRKKA